MRKEVIAAIILGLVTGGIVAFGIYLARTSLQQRVSQSRTDQASTIEETSMNGQDNDELAIFSPENETISEQNTVQISGKTEPNATVFFLVNETDDYLTTADDSGNFATTLTLSLGGNFIVTTVFLSDGRTVEDVRVIAYSSADLTASPPATASAQTTEEE